jgi:Protein of unknown function (DUF2469)
MSDEEIERFEDELELRLWREYRDVLPMFDYLVETERRFYLANHVEMVKHDGPAEVWLELELTDAWVWDMYRPSRFVSRVRVVSFRDVNIEDLSRKDIRPEEAIGESDRPEPTEGHPPA